GGILFTPILFVVFSKAGIENPVVLAIASSLFCTFVAALGSSIRQFKQQNFYWSEGLKVGILGAFGVTLGKLIITSQYYNKQEFVVVFSLLLFYVAFMFYRRGSRKSSNLETNRRELTWRQSIVTGGLGGFVAALAGIGGGGVMVPLMNLFYKKDFSKSISISSLAIVLISFSGCLQLAYSGNGVEALTHFHLGYVDFGAAFPLAAGGLFGGFLGAFLHLKIDRRYLQYAFSVLAVIMALKLITEVF
ncbi:MAG: sulfite exporter TauE/SafE family protein, partial [Balneolaceae bacterium]